MDINLLVQRLKHGDSYMVQDGDNDPYQVNNPPNHLMIKAANVILHLDQQLQHSSAVVNNLQNQLTELAQQYETLRTNNTATTSS
jgi:CII-binding regulator of phage lambda lysogenization HflD